LLFFKKDVKILNLLDGKYLDNQTFAEGPVALFVNNSMLLHDNRGNTILEAPKKDAKISYLVANVQKNY